MENMEMMNNVDVVEGAVEGFEAPAENSGNGLKIALTVGAIALGGWLLYTKVIKPAITRNQINTDESKDVNVNNKPAGMKATHTHNFHS